MDEDEDDANYANWREWGIAKGRQFFS